MMVLYCKIEYLCLRKCLCICVIGRSSRATDFYPEFPSRWRWSTSQKNNKTGKKNCSTCPPKYPRYMRNCYCVALKNLLLSLGFCTYLQLISISIYFSFFFSLDECVCVRFFMPRLQRATTKIRVIIFMNEYFVAVLALKSVVYTEMSMIFKIISESCEVISR